VLATWGNIGNRVSITDNRVRAKMHRILTFPQMVISVSPTLKDFARTRTRTLMTAITGSTLLSRHD
jgi:hypothetical protein